MSFHKPLKQLNKFAGTSNYHALFKFPCILKYCAFRIYSRTSNMNSAIECMYEGASEKCGVKAAHWITHMNKLGAEGLADLLSCSLQV